MNKRHNWTQLEEIQNMPKSFLRISYSFVLTRFGSISDLRNQRIRENQKEKFVTGLLISIFLLKDSLGIKTLTEIYL